MTQVSGLFPAIADNERKLLRNQLLPLFGKKKPKRRGPRPPVELGMPGTKTDLGGGKVKVKLPGLQTGESQEQLSPLEANASKFSSVKPMEGGYSARKRAAFKKY